MIKVSRIKLDILKPHTPNVLEFTTTLASRCAGYHFHLDVMEVDEHTETIMLDIEAEHVDYQHVADLITELGGSIHSIDEVEVMNSGEADASEVS